MIRRSRMIQKKDKKIKKKKIDLDLD